MKTVKPQAHEKSAVRDTQANAKVRLGAMTPTFPQVKVAPKASGKVRMGAMTRLSPSVKLPNGYDRQRKLVRNERLRCPALRSPRPLIRSIVRREPRDGITTVNPLIGRGRPLRAPEKRTAGRPLSAPVLLRPSRRKTTRNTPAPRSADKAHVGADRRLELQFHPQLGAKINIKLSLQYYRPSCALQKSPLCSIKCVNIVH